MHKEIIATIDIGSSKIIAAAGKKDQNGTIQILAWETETTKTSVRRGRIYNVNEVNNKIAGLLDRLNLKLNEKISKIYAGVGGQSLLTETYSVVEETDGIIVNEELLRSLREKCENYHPEFSEVLDIVSPEYFIDGKPEKKPIGVSCKKLEIRYQLILGNPSIKRNINKCISEKNEIKIAGYFISPLATATATLTDLEKNLGCALIEFGAGVTYLSVYKNGLLKYLATIPLGGNVITKDICDLNILEDEAEDLKLKYGRALVANKNEEKFSIKINSGQNKEIEIDQLNDIIEARTEEIIANIKNQLELSGFSNSIGSGIIITGGAAGLKNLAESIEEKTKQKVRIAHVKEELIENDSLEYGKISGAEETIGLLSLGTENCILVKEPVNPVVVQPVVNPENSLFSEEEIEVVEKEKKTNQKGGKIKKPEGKEVPGFFGKIAGSLNRASKGLFDSADATEEDEENKR